ncbi:ABC transporter permease [Thermococcus sp. M39]|uniref:ABC transporter permease n=1 Tax=unclassified Thermococcus TaxID=2627626 RepID=UPI00143C1E92|nr:MULTISPECIES: ABC transporter permease [unclassified Thermococcus]NJE07024.1 ABC transporter permease [Thermococcus sp. M39]NJE12924.1 ABC transporter permease [Thermococcus sp. LS2]
MIGVLYENEVYRLLKSRRLKVMIVLMLLPVVVYFFTHEEITEYSAKALKISFQINVSEFLINFWGSVIGQLIVIILMSELLASEIDKGTMRLLLVKPIKKSEIVFGKFFAGMTGIILIFGIPYFVMQIYMVLLYKSGFDGFRATFGDFLFALGVTLLILGSLGAFSMFLSVILSRPLYASLASFGIIFTAQFILPQLPFFDDPERFNLSYQIGVLLKKGFTLHAGLDAYKGDPNMSALFFLSIILLSLAFTLLGIYRKEYEG